MEKILRTDRIFPLKDASFYPGKDFCDMVYFCPPTKQKKRLWLLTEAKKPVVYIDHYRFEPVKIFKKGRYRWIDFGITDIEFALPRGFGQLKFYGISKQQAEDSYFVITKQVKLRLSGSIEDAEKKLAGISRQVTGFSFINPSTVEVGSPVVFNMIYMAGKNGLPANTYLRLNIPKVFTGPQITKKGDGYISAIDSEAEIVFKEIRDVSDESHRDVDVIYFLPQGIKPYGKIVFQYRTDRSFIVPVESLTMDRRYWYSNLPVLSPAVSFENKKIFVPLSEKNGHCVRFVSGKPKRLFLFLPRRIKKREKVRLVGIITDRFRNIVSDKNWKMKIEICLEGKQEKQIKDISNHFTDRHRFYIDFTGLKPGIYRAKAYDMDTGKLLAISNPVEIMDEKDERDQIFWGEIHGHTEMSDGTGAFENLYYDAKHNGSLDFAAAADHACYFTDNQWEWMQDITNSFNKDGEFCTLVGYEWAGNQGHRNIYTSRNRLKLFRGMYEPHRDLGIVYREFEGVEDVVAGPHTGHTGDFWAFHNRDVERFIEIYSMWGHFDSLVNKLLNEGAILGFTGGGDCHSGKVFLSAEDREGQGKTPHFTYSLRYKSGIMAALMKELNRKQLIYALRNRKTYATTSDRILVDFSVSGLAMGKIGKADDVFLKAIIHGCDRIRKIEVIKDGKIVHTERPDVMDVIFSWQDKRVEKGIHWYYITITQANREVAYTSPVWLEL